MHVAAQAAGSKMGNVRDFTHSQSETFRRKSDHLPHDHSDPDFTTIYLSTGKVRVAAGFMIASNVCTTVAYVLHERAWARIGWGSDNNLENDRRRLGQVRAG